MSRLEHFIRDHRDEFDDEQPSPQVWADLQKDLGLAPAVNKGKVVTMKILRWSVAAAILVLAGFGVFHLINNKSGNPQVAGGKTTIDTPALNDDILQKINPTYASEMYHFTRLIELKQEELKKIETVNPDLYKSFMADINQLDSSYNALKKELPENPNREQLLEAMLENLKIQSALLNQQLQVIQKIKQSKQETNGKII